MALAAPPQLHPSRRGDAAGTRLYSALKPINIEDPHWDTASARGELLFNLVASV